MEEKLFQETSLVNTLRKEVALLEHRLAVEKATVEAERRKSNALEVPHNNTYIGLKRVKDIFFSRNKLVKNLKQMDCLLIQEMRRLHLVLAGCHCLNHLGAAFGLR